MIGSAPLTHKFPVNFLKKNYEVIFCVRRMFLVELDGCIFKDVVIARIYRPTHKNRFVYLRKKL